MRIGHGYDAHRLSENRPLVLGGVTVPFSMGLLGHSDADVLLHSICDALLGAAALPDIGAQFPDSDSRYAGISSLKLLETVGKLLKVSGFSVCNIDATVIAQKPKLAPFIKEMRCNIAAALNIEIESVNVKATTEEGMSFTGKGEGISAHAVCLLSETAE